MPRMPQIARDISYAHSAQTRGGRAMIRTMENLTGRIRLIKRAAGYEHEVAAGRDFWQVMVERYGLSLDVVGGSLANNDPSACYPSAVLGSGAVIRTNTREIAADDFFEGLFTTALHDGEIIVEVRFDIPEAASYQKFLQPASRFALTGVFVARYADAVRVAVTGASEDGVFRWSEAEAALSGDFSAAALEGLTVPSDGMISDLHGTAEYRAHLVKVMTKRAVEAA